MGQEIVYCSKCQKRILGSDYAKGLAFELENSSCCSACAVGVLDTLAPKAKEQLLAKLVKANQERAPMSSAASRAGSPPASMSRKIPLATAAPEGSLSPAMLGVGIAVLLLGGLLLAVVLSSGGSASPRPITPPSARPEIPREKPSSPGPSPEEGRRDAAAREALRKAKEFAQAHPNDFDGQIRQWQAALLDAERSGFELEVRRELEKIQARAREALARDLEGLGRDVRAAGSRKEWKAALDLLAQARPRKSSPEWTGGIEGLERDLRSAADRAFQDLKAAAVAARVRGDKAAVEQSRGEIARWGFPEYVEQLNLALVPAWTPLFDGKTTDFMSSRTIPDWKVEDGALVHAHGQADQESGQSREHFADGEVRYRFFQRGEVNALTFAVRENSRRVVFNRPAVIAMGEGEHEIVFSCRGNEVSATLDGKPISVEAKNPILPKGRLQWNARDGVFRVLSIEFRALP
jgi:hypothetical protein